MPSSVADRLHDLGEDFLLVDLARLDTVPAVSFMEWPGILPMT